jgi:hypothetical protein
MCDTKYFTQALNEYLDWPEAEDLRAQQIDDRTIARYRQMRPLKTVSELSLGELSQILRRAQELKDAEGKAAPDQAALDHEAWVAKERARYANGDAK